MLRYGVFLLAVALAVARPHSEEGKIVGGRDTDIREVPHQLSLQYRPSSIYVAQHICGASIVASKWALSAAHCLLNTLPGSFVIRAGSSIRGEGGIEYEVMRIEAHPDWDMKTMNADFVLFEISTPFDLSNVARIVELAMEEEMEGTMATVSGWGKLSENGQAPKQLQSVSVPLVTRDVCRSVYGSRINQNMICAGYDEGQQDSCQGDSGGPLVVRKGSRTVQIGVVSFGKGCARPRYVGVYSNIVAQRSWIDGIVNIF